MTQAEDIRQTAHAQDARLIADGVIVGTAGKPVQVRNPDASGVTTKAGPFMTSELPVAGFALIEADSLDDAIKKVSGVPCAVTQGVVEVWPLG